jgi:hypothetical protein
MIRKISSILIALLCSINFVFAQTKEQNIEEQFKSLQLNSSPAYVVLGVEPENIQRPNSPNDFIASVQSALVNDRLQPNFAMETSPYYWGKKKPDSKKFNVYDYILKNDYWDNLAKSISFSFATSPSDSFTFGSIPVGTGLGIGMHMQLVHGKVSNNVRKNLSEWFLQGRMNLLLEQLAEILEQGGKIDDMGDYIDKAISRGSLKEMSAEDKNIISNLLKNKLTGKDLSTINSLIKISNDSSKAAIKRVNAYQFPLTREGFMLEFAIANASVAGNNNWNKLQSAKTSIWLTPSYRFNVNKDFIDLMAVLRVTINAKNVDSTSYADLGGKLQWVHNKLSVSGEGIFRYLTNKPQNQKKNYTVRTAFTLSYKLNELVTFKATFGSNFDGNSTHYSDPSKMFAVGGFHFGFSNFLKNAKATSK